MSAGPLPFSTFAGRAGETFHAATGPETSVALELIRATPLAPIQARSGSIAGREDPFVLVFRGPSTPPLPQQIYAFEHDELGTLEIFIVPIGPEGGGLAYEAIFH